MTATFTGVHEHDHRLPDWSRSGCDADLAEMRSLHARLAVEHPLPVGGLAALRTDAVALDAELARANLDVRMAESESAHFRDQNPALWTGEAIFGCVSLMIRPFASIEERLPALRARLAAIPAFLADMRLVIHGPVPALWTQRALRECVAAQLLFGDGLTQWLTSHDRSADRHSVNANSMAPSDIAGVYAAAAEARSAFTASAAWLEACIDADAASLSCGEPLLTTLLRRGHFCEEAPRSLLARAEEHLATSADDLLRDLGDPFDGSWAAVQAAIVADHPAVGEYYGTFARRWREIREAVVSHDMVTWPEWPIRYVPIPLWARAVSPALYWLFYRSPAPFDRYEVHDYVVTPIDQSMSSEVQQARLEACNHSTITLNHVAHHGGVGHHVQNWHAIYRSSSRIGTVAAVDAASRIGMFLGGSMAEGWACYATLLVGELNPPLLTDLESRSEQHSSVRMAARAVVDLRLHLGDWSFDQCVQFYESTVGMTRTVATAETTKNSMFPGTALMYWLGTDGILTLRAQCRAQQGEQAFALKAFHDELLSRGAIPVPLVARLMTRES